MAEPCYPAPAKLFVGFLYSEEEQLLKITEALTFRFGNADLESGPIPFTNTDYYREIGSFLLKKLVSFERLIVREEMTDIKIFTNGIESEMYRNGIRTVNIDPGYMTLSNVFLASCKDFYHRVYIGKGVYLENEYRFVKGGYEFWPWTYPDFKKDEYLKFFYEVRKIYHAQMRT